MNALFFLIFSLLFIYFNNKYNVTMYIKTTAKIIFTTEKTKITTKTPNKNKNNTKTKTKTLNDKNIYI